MQPKTCIFCGAERPEDVEWPPEHWIPDWVSRAVVGPDQAIEHHSSDGRVWYALVFEYTVGRVCADCNHHWMSNIETRASRLARRLVLGEPQTSLLAQEQEVLARWCYLKVITLELGRPPDQVSTYPDLVYAGFREHRKPPGSSCDITIGRREIPPGDPYVWFRSQGGRETYPGLGEAATYRTALCIGHLAIEAIGVLDARANVQIGDADPRRVRIWPVSNSKVTLPTESFVGIVDNDLV